VRCFDCCDKLTQIQQCLVGSCNLRSIPATSGIQWNPDITYLDLTFSLDITLRKFLPWP
jgi:hypothetical protein